MRPRAAPEPTDALKPTPRAVSLIAAAQATTDVATPQAVKTLLGKWRSQFPDDLQEEFRPAFEEAAVIPDDSVANVLSFSRARYPLPDVLAGELLREDSPAAAKRRGSVYTPAWLAARVTRNALAHWRRLHRSGRGPEVIADLSCGVGVFLDACAKALGSGVRIMGVDKDPRAVAYARLLAWVTHSDWTISCGDTLLARRSRRLLFDFAGPEADTPHYDVLIGNPPFVRSALLPPSYADRLRIGYPSTDKGNFDLSVAFVEHAIDSLNEGSIASYILTSKFMTSSYGKAICRRLAHDVRVLEVEDFQDAQVFPRYTTYTCVLTLAKKPPAKRFLVTHFPEGVSGTADPGRGKTATLPTERLAAHPWSFAADTVHEALRLLGHADHPQIEDVFGRILQGLRTGANHVFVVPSTDQRGIEEEVLAPFITGEHIRRFRVNTKALRLLFPYTRNEFGEMALLRDDELRKQYPGCWRYLCSYRSALTERSRDEGQPWYAFSRSQNLELASLRKILVREMLPRAEFACDRVGNVAFASGYALDATRMTEDDLAMWTAILCTATMEFALRHHGTQLQSGWFRLLKHHLRRVRLPSLTEDQKQEAVRLAGALEGNPNDPVAWECLDGLVARAFRLKDEHRSAISEFLVDCHKRSLPRAATLPGGTTLQVDSPCGRSRYEPVRLDRYEPLHRDRADLRSAVTFVPNKTAPVHRWYRYNQGFSSELVLSLLDELGIGKQTVVLDPFVGCGTTSLVCRERGIPSVGIEISPLMVWVAKTKTRNWRVTELRQLVDGLRLPSPAACENRAYEASPFWPYLRKAFSTGVLRQLWTFGAEFSKGSRPPTHRDFLKLGLLSIMEDVSQIRKHGSHYRYMLRTESIGLQKLNTPIVAPETDIRPHLLSRLQLMVEDVAELHLPRPLASCVIDEGDCRDQYLRPGSAGAVITSPPYLNRNNYIAQQKAELALLSMICDSGAYRNLVRRTLRSHVEAAFPKGRPRSKFPEVSAILDSIVLSQNNNPKIPHMIGGYFDDLAAVLEELHRVLTPGAPAAFVVGNSRWGGVVVPVDHLLLMTAESTGFKAEKILVTRLKGNSPQQMRRYGRIPVRESIVIFRKQ